MSLSHSLYLPPIPTIPYFILSLSPATFPPASLLLIHSALHDDKYPFSSSTYALCVCPLAHTKSNTHSHTRTHRAPWWITDSLLTLGTLSLVGEKGREGGHACVCAKLIATICRCVLCWVCVCVWVCVHEEVVGVIALSLCGSVFEPVQHAAWLSPLKRHTDAQQHPRGPSKKHTQTHTHAHPHAYSVYRLIAARTHRDREKDEHTLLIFIPASLEKKRVLLWVNKKSGGLPSQRPPQSSLSPSFSLYPTFIQLCLSFFIPFLQFSEMAPCGLLGTGGAEKSIKDALS